MEDKQLNFNQPLLSVRRFTPAVPTRKDERKTIDKSAHGVPPLPFYKSELKSGPVRHPGTVPFVWEHSPGRPKEESKLKNHATERPPDAPKLPPGRTLNARESICEDPSPSKEQTGKGSSHFQNVPTLDDNTPKSEISRDTMEDESSDSGDGDEAYLDALDTLARTESEFLNCSVSGISALGGPNLKPSEMFSTDPQTRDFMMGRFLPAAMAMASETPPNVPRKQPAAQRQPEFREQPKPVEDVSNGIRRPSLRYGTSFARHYAEDHEEDESDDDYDERGNSSLKVCGLLPRFCLKGSFCLLNPVPAMSVRTRVTVSPVVRSLAGSSSIGSCSEPDKENGIHEKGSVGLERTVPHENRRVEKKDANKNSHKKPNEPFQDRHMSRFYNESTQSSNEPQQTLAADLKNAAMNVLNLQQKGYASFLELLADGDSNGQTDSPTSAFEKTLYVDTVHKLESPKINSCSSDSVEKFLPSENDLEILARSKGMEEAALNIFALQKIENAHVKDGGSGSLSNVLKSSDLKLPPSADSSQVEVGMDTMKGSQNNKDPYKDSAVPEKLEVPADLNLKIEDQNPPKADTLNDSHRTYPEFPVPPPLPKSPTDSWLCRTLPSISSKNSSSRGYLGSGINSRNQAPKTSSFVKTLNEEHQHFPFSKGLMAPIPENQ